MYGQQKKTSPPARGLGEQWHIVYHLTRPSGCSDWSCGEQDDWVTTYHKTTPNQFQIELAVAPISVTHCFNMLRGCAAHWISLNKIYRMGRPRRSPHLSRLYSDGIHSKFFPGDVGAQQTTTGFSVRAKSEDNVSSQECKSAISRATEDSPISFIRLVFIQQYSFSEYNQYKMYMTKYTLNRTEDFR